jgi:hypothetical protein
MKLLDLLQLVADSLQANQPSVAEQLGYDPDYTEVYMLGQLALESELRFFDVGETDYELVYIKDGQEYVSLFMLWFGIEQIEALLKTQQYTPATLAQRVLEYRIKDA